MCLGLRVGFEVGVGSDVRNNTRCVAIPFLKVYSVITVDITLLTRSKKVTGQDGPCGVWHSD